MAQMQWEELKEELERQAQVYRERMERKRTPVRWDWEETVKPVNPVNPAPKPEPETRPAPGVAEQLVVALRKDKPAVLLVLASCLCEQPDLDVAVEQVMKLYTAGDDSEWANRYAALLLAVVGEHMLQHGLHSKLVKENVWALTPTASSSLG